MMYFNLSSFILFLFNPVSSAISLKQAPLGLFISEPSICPPIGTERPAKNSASSLFSVTKLHSCRLAEKLQPFVSISKKHLINNY